MPRSTSVSRSTPRPDPRASALAMLLLGACVEPPQGAPVAPAVPPPIAVTPPPHGACWDPAEDRRDVIDRPRDARERLANVAVGQELRELHVTIGRYSRGERPLYAGTLRARDNFGANGGSARDGALDGAVWAVLLREAAHPSDPPRSTAELVIVSVAGRTKLSVLQQRTDTDLTMISPVTAWTTNAGAIGECRNCLPSLFNAHPRIEFRSLVAKQRFDRFEGRASVDGRLDRIPPSSITLAQIARAHDLDSWGRSTGAGDQK